MVGERFVAEGLLTGVWQQYSFERKWSGKKVKVLRGCGQRATTAPVLGK